MLNNTRFFLTVIAAAFSLAGCNPPAARSQASFNAAGQELGQGHVGASATDVGHGFSNGAQATGQTINNAFTAK
jgi:hypothetical protein